MKKIIIIILTLLLITGCTNGSMQEHINTLTNKNIGNEKTIAVSAEDKEKNEEIITESSELSQTTFDSSTVADIEVMNYISNIELEINTLTNSENLTMSVKSKLKESFITLTDFIFYNGTIKGVTFNELSTSVKEKVLEIYTSIDQKIELVWPNYKETIKITSKNIYTNISEKALELKENLQNKYKESIGEETYNNSIEIFEEDIDRLKESVSPTIDYVTEKGKETYENIKDKASNWYENYKESSE